MNDFLRDLKHGARVLLKKPGFAAVAILSLALGIGANTSIFSLVDSILLRPLPIQKPDQVVSIYNTVKSTGGFSAFSYPTYVDYRDRNQCFSGVAAYRFVPISLSYRGQSRRVWGYLVSGNYFDMLGVTPLLGRGFLPEEDRTPDTHPVAVISYSYWQNEFAADPVLIGKTITLNGRDFTVVGVAPKGFVGTEIAFEPKIWVPMMMQKEIEPGRAWLNERGERGLQLVARIKPDENVPQAQASFRVLVSQLAKEYKEPDTSDTAMLARPGLFTPGLRDAAKSFSLILMAVVGLVLLIACANIANLLLARASERRKEIAIRLALGASRPRLVRQLLTESLILAAAGGVLGVVLAVFMNRVLSAVKPPVDFALATNIQVDSRVLGFSFLLSLATAVLFGIIPALQATRPDIGHAIKEEASAGGNRRNRMRNTLVIAQLALSMILLVSAGLIVRSLRQTQLIDPGFDPSNAIEMSFDLALQSYDNDRGRAFQRHIVEQAGAIQGVQAAALTTYVPLGLDRSTRSIFIDGQELRRDEELPDALYAHVSAAYFAAMKIPMIGGRGFTEQDKQESTKVAVINQEFARRFWPGQDAVGKHLRFGGSTSPLIEVVGIAKDGKYLSLTDTPRPFVYTPLAQEYQPATTLIIRTERDPRAVIASIRSEVSALDPALPIFDIETLTDHLGLALFPARVAAAVLGCFGLLALVLSGIGVYGVISYGVSQRTREIGIRMALGADKSDILRSVVGQGLLLATVGLGLGLAISVGITRFLGQLLYGVSPTDLATFMGVSLLLGLIAAIASYVPGRRATGIDPMSALRYE